MTHRVYATNATRIHSRRRSFDNSLEREIRRLLRAPRFQSHVHCQSHVATHITPCHLDHCRACRLHSTSTWLQVELRRCLLPFYCNSTALRPSTTYVTTCVWAAALRPIYIINRSARLRPVMCYVILTLMIFDKQSNGRRIEVES